MIDLERRVGAAAARRHQHIRRLQKGRDFRGRPFAGENRQRVDRRGTRLQLRPLDLTGLSPREQQPHVGPFPPDHRHGIEQEIEALVGFERASVDDERRLGADAERLPQG